MYTKKEIEAFKELEKMGFCGFTYNSLCYKCKKFYSGCNGIKGKSNFPCVKFVPEKNMEKVKYELAKDIIYQIGVLYDGKKHGIVLVSCTASDDNVINSVLAYKKVYEGTYEKVFDEIMKMKVDNTRHCVCCVLTSEGIALETCKGIHETLFKTVDKDYSECLMKLGLDISKI